MKVKAMLVEPELKLPEPPPPRGNYLAVVQHGSLLFISGQFPFIHGQLAYRGKLGRNLDVADGYQAARLCAMNALAHLQNFLSSLEPIIGPVHDYPFVRQPNVAGAFREVNLEQVGSLPVRPREDRWTASARELSEPVGWPLPPCLCRAIRPAGRAPDRDAPSPP